MITGEQVPRADAKRRRPGRRALLVVLVPGSAGLAAFAVLRLVVSGLLGMDGNRYTTAALALTPYVVPVGATVAVLALAGRQLRLGAGCLALTVLLAVPLLPRVVPNAAPAADGPTLRVLAINLYFGEADAGAIVDLVAEHRVDVLNLLELDEAGQSALDRAGLTGLLPHRVFRPAGAAVGSGIASRYPLDELDLAGPSWFAQPGARVRLGRGAVVEVVAVHPIPPVTRADDWRAELRSLPPASPAGPVRILAGDFNATLDHAELRRVLDSGYVDAAERTGEALVPTWPRRRTAPPVTLDHVLVDERAAVLGFSAHDVPGSDHRAVLAELRLPS